MGGWVDKRWVDGRGGTDLGQEVADSGDFHGAHIVHLGAHDGAAPQHGIGHALETASDLLHADVFCCGWRGGWVGGEEEEEWFVVVDWDDRWVGGWRR